MQYLLQCIRDRPCVCTVFMGSYIVHMVTFLLSFLHVHITLNVILIPILSTFIIMLGSMCEYILYPFTRSTWVVDGHHYACVGLWMYCNQAFLLPKCTWVVAIDVLMLPQTLRGLSPLPLTHTGWLEDSSFISLNARLLLSVHPYQL